VLLFTGSMQEPIICVFAPGFAGIIVSLAYLVAVAKCRPFIDTWHQSQELFYTCFEVVFILFGFLFTEYTDDVQALEYIMVFLVVFVYGGAFLMFGIFEVSTWYTVRMSKYKVMKLVLAKDEVRKEICERELRAHRDPNLPSLIRDANMIFNIKIEGKKSNAVQILRRCKELNFDGSSFLEPKKRSSSFFHGSMNENDFMIPKARSNALPFAPVEYFSFEPPLQALVESLSPDGFSLWVHGKLTGEQVENCRVLAVQLEDTLASTHPQSVYSKDTLLQRMVRDVPCLMDWVMHSLRRAERHDFEKKRRELCKLFTSLEAFQEKQTAGHALYRPLSDGIVETARAQVLYFLLNKSKPKDVVAMHDFLEAIDAHKETHLIQTVSSKLCGIKTMETKEERRARVAIKFKKAMRKFAKLKDEERDALFATVPSEECKEDSIVWRSFSKRLPETFQVEPSSTSSASAHPASPPPASPLPASPLSSSMVNKEMECGVGGEGDEAVGAPVSCNWPVNMPSGRDENIDCRVTASSPLRALEMPAQVPTDAFAWMSLLSTSNSTKKYCLDGDEEAVASTPALSEGGEENSSPSRSIPVPSPPLISPQGAIEWLTSQLLPQPAAQDPEPPLAGSVAHFHSTTI